MPTPEELAQVYGRPLVPEGFVPKQPDPFHLPPETPPLERAIGRLPPASTPVEQGTREGMGKILGFTPIGAGFDLAEAYGQGDMGTMGLLAAGAIPLPGANAGKPVARLAGKARQAWEAAPLPGAKFSQYAETYPAAGPPIPKPKTDPSFPGETYDAKLLTPAAKEFEKARNKIRNDMSKSGYEPYFDPEKRFYVDPKNYPGPNVDTLTLQPVKQETIDNYLQVINAPQTKQLLRAAYKQGQKLGNAEDWYAMGQLEAEYVKQLGPDKGREAFLDEFATSMAATTSGQSPGPNFAMSHYFEYLRKRGEPIPQEAHQFPTPVGGRRANVNLRDYENMRERGGYAGLGGEQPKMHNFSRSFIGDLTRAVMDEQMSAGMFAHILGKDPKFADRARQGAYGLVEKPLHDVAKQKGLSPGNVQDVAWAGFKNEGPGQPMISEINESIERTHRLTGMPRNEIVRRGLVLKEIPMYGAGGVLATGAIGELARRDRYEQ